MSRTSVVVVGGGVIGLACAWELTRGGAEVTVIERDAVGGGVSRGNTGWVVPSMTSPLPAPGMVREGVRQLVTRGDAFVLRPSLDPAFVRWLWRFWRSSSPARFGAGVRALLALNRRTLELFDAYREAGIRFEMHATGLLIAARTRAGLRQYDEVFRRLRALGYEGGEPDQLDRDALAELEPALDRRNVEAGLHARVDGYVRPEDLMHGLANAFVRTGTRSSKDASSSSCEAIRMAGRSDERRRAARAEGRRGRRAGVDRAPRSFRRPGRRPACARLQRHDRRTW